MPTPITHLFAAIPVNIAIMGAVNKKKIILLSLIISILPDLDLIGYFLGLPISSFLGHRGFTHSIFFALVVALMANLLFFPDIKTKDKRFKLLFLNFLFVALTHPLLDFLVNRNTGVALLSPFVLTRFASPIAPIVEESVGILNYYHFYFKEVVKVEFFYIILPSLIYTMIWTKIFFKSGILYKVKNKI